MEYNLNKKQISADVDDEFFAACNAIESAFINKEKEFAPSDSVTVAVSESSLSNTLSAPVGSVAGSASESHSVCQLLISGPVAASESLRLTDSVSESASNSQSDSAFSESESATVTVSESETHSLSGLDNENTINEFALVHASTVVLPLATDDSSKLNDSEHEVLQLEQQQLSESDSATCVVDFVAFVSLSRGLRLPVDSHLV